MVFLIRKSDWRIIRLDGEPAIRVTCPLCKGTWLLNHQVDADGTIWPSMRCVDEQCNFHADIVLENWKSGT